MGENDGVRRLVPKDQAEAYGRAREVMTRLLPELRDVDDHDAMLALQLLLAKHAQAAGYRPAMLLRVLDTNLPGMYEIWEKANEPIIHKGGADAGDEEPT